VCGRTTITCKVMHDSEYFLAVNPTQEDLREVEPENFDGVLLGAYIVLMGGAVQCLASFDSLEDALEWLDD